MSDHDEYAEWDAAYVLGALSAAQRREFEDHLAGCPPCAGSVGEFAALPGLLAKVNPGDAFAMLGADAAGTPPASAERVPSGILSGLIARVRRRRRVRTWIISAGGVVAAAAIVAAFVVPVALNAPAGPTVAVSLQQVVSSPISADVQLTEAGWGTEIALTCRYSAAGVPASSGEYPAAQPYALYVIDRSGAIVRVSSWNADPGDTVHAVGSIDTALSEITRVELRSLDTGTVLLSHTFGKTASG